MLLTVLISSLNSALLIALLFIYGRMAMKTRAIYSVGLAVFAILLLSQNLLSVYSYVTMDTFFGDEVVPYLLGIGSLEFFGLIALLRNTLG